VNDADNTQVSASQPLDERVNNRSQRPSSDAFKAFMASNWAPSREQLPERDAVAGHAATRRRAISEQFKGNLTFPAGDDLSADEFVANEPLNKAGVYERVEIHRWSNSFQKRASDYRRKGLQQFLCTGPKTGSPEFFREHLHAHESYFASYGDSFIFRGPIRSADGADNIGTALMLELPDRAAADKFWNEEPFAKNGGYRSDSRITRWVFGDSVS